MTQHQMNWNDAEFTQNKSKETDRHAGKP